MSFEERMKFYKDEYSASTAKNQGSKKKPETKTKPEVQKAQEVEKKEKPQTASVSSTPSHPSVQPEKKTFWTKVAGFFKGEKK